MWFFYSISFALISTLSIVIAKRIMNDGDEYSYLLINQIFSLPIIFAVILIFASIPKIDDTFIFVSIVVVVLNTIAAIAAYKAIRKSDLSLVNPISAFTPVFTGIFAIFFLNELIPLKGWFGILLIVVGAYLLQISKRKEGWLVPFRFLLSHKGVRLSLLAYFLWSIIANFQKIAINHTSPVVPAFASLVTTVMSTIIFIPIVAKFGNNPIRLLKKHFKCFVLSGILGGIGQAVAFGAYSSGNLGYVTAVFKLSMIFTVFMGWLFFKEKNIKERLLGSVVMLGGVVLLVI